jgi:hypothetical protein
MLKSAGTKDILSFSISHAAALQPDPAGAQRRGRAGAARARAPRRAAVERLRGHGGRGRGAGQAAGAPQAGGSSGFDPLGGPAGPSRESPYICPAGSRGLNSYADPASHPGPADLRQAPVADHRALLQGAVQHGREMQSLVGCMQPPFKRRQSLAGCNGGAKDAMCLMCPLLEEHHLRRRRRLRDGRAAHRAPGHHVPARDANSGGARGAARPPWPRGCIGFPPTSF